MTILEQINEQFPVRKNKAQKKEFRKWLMQRISTLGYSVRVEQNNKGRHQNVIVGSPEHAQVTFCAHYDTPATIGIPDLQIPRNFALYLLFQLGMIFGMLAISLLVGVGLGLLTKNGDVMVISFVVTFVVLMWLQLAGKPNKHNVNDNTSGVAALLELMTLLPEDKRRNAAFIFFDNQEKGNRGSKAFARDHLEVQHTKLVVSLDCVGVGEHMLVMAPKLAAQLPQYADLEKCLAADDRRQVRFYSSFTTRGTSDFRSFKCGVGITAYEYSSGVGYHLGAIHTAKDTEADQENLDFLAQVLCGYVSDLGEKE